ncbi:DNA repair protein RAD51 homolog 3-like isoform X2 [Brevipalpus obovatus]|uniref:DNA repair protein RAD51 homolog 3-like isoform X2 n=1 Tax=Brevipalpus obovatus TaxID=246614 RepID=UPI003D9E0DF2
MSKPIQCYDLPSKLIKVLCDHGFAFSGDLLRLSPEQLQKVTSLSLDQCSIILDEINSTVRLRGTNALQLLKQEVQNDGSIFTFCPPLNDLLHDGFPVGKLIEVAGESGTGKTQLCLQLCINTQISEKFGGLGGEAVFIDTENSFRQNRLIEITQNIESRFSRDDEFTSDDLNVDKVLDGTIVEYCYDWTYFRAIILGKLDKIIEARPKVRLIVIDSIAYLLRYDFSGAAKARDEIVWEICNKLKILAIKHRICIAVMMHVPPACVDFIEIPLQETQ